MVFSQIRPRAVGAPVRMALALAAALLAALSCGCASQSTAATGTPSPIPARAVAKSTASAPAPASAGTVPAGPAVARPVSRVPVVSTPVHIDAAWRQVASVGGQPAAWMARSAGITLLRFDQSAARLVLHAGSAEPGGGFPHGARIEGSEAHRVLAGFNGGFKFSYGSVGFMAGGRVAVPLAAGLGSIVTYSDGATQIGAWHAGVPARGRAIASVRQNLHLLVDHGRAAGNVEACALGCWGSTLGGGVRVPRSALGIDSQGDLVWAAGENASPASLASVLVGAGVQRAVELDINPYWVAGYVYVHRAGGPLAVPVVPGQHGIGGSLLAPDGRDFFTVVAR